jgi:hypothetical protein
MNSSTVKIPLTGKHGQGKFALVSARDAWRVSRYTWSLQLTGASGGKRRKLDVIRSGNGDKKHVHLHRFIMRSYRRGLVVDHKNHDRLNNTRENLRVISYSENAQNTRISTRAGKTSKFKGVYRRGRRWAASISVKGVPLFLGTFTNEYVAASVYAMAAFTFFKDYAFVGEYV